MKENLYRELKDMRVTKSNALIQKSRFNLTLQQQKMILYIISTIQPDDTSFEFMTFRIVDFCRICGIDNAGGTNYTTLKAAIKDLRDKSLWIDSIDGKKSVLISWIEKAILDNEDGTISIKLDDYLKPYLLQLRKNFTTYELIYTLRMKHKSSLRLYEFIKSIHYDELYPYTTYIALDSLRQVMGAEDKETYKEYKYFHLKVLKPAIEEINALTDKIIEYKPMKDGRSVVGIKITISTKKPMDRMRLLDETDIAFNNYQLSFSYLTMREKLEQEAKDYGE